MKLSLFSTSLRALFITFFGMVGIGLGLIPLIFLISLAARDIDEKIAVKDRYAPVLVGNQEGTRKTVDASSPLILKVNIDGLIGTDALNRNTIHSQLVESREGVLKNERVKAVLLHISSPGGTVTDSDAIYRAVKAYKKRYNTPVFAYVDGLCASGGMYVASAADKILASEVSLVGSVGVIFSPFFNVSSLLEKMGIESKTLLGGKGKDDMNPFRPWKPGEEESLQKILDANYAHFIEVVDTNRPKLSKRVLIEELGARILPSAEAVEVGMIDRSGVSLEESIRSLAEAANIADQPYGVIKMQKKLSLPELFQGGSHLMQGHVIHQVEWHPSIPKELHNQFLYLWMPN